MNRSNLQKLVGVYAMVLVCIIAVVGSMSSSRPEKIEQDSSEWMRLAESIMSQMTIGTGAPRIAAEFRDEIIVFDAAPTTFSPKKKGIYYADVAVPNFNAWSADTANAEARKRSNVQEIECQVYVMRSATPPEDCPGFVADDKIQFTRDEVPKKIGGWNLEAVHVLTLDLQQTHNWKYPVYQEKVYGREDVISFKYDDTSFVQPAAGSSNLMIRRFAAELRPGRTTGWYKLRFTSRTNSFVGVGGEYAGVVIPDSAQVKLGTISLTARQLRMVRSRLADSLQPGLQSIGQKLPDTMLLSGLRPRPREFREAMQEVQRAVGEQRPNIQSVTGTYSLQTRLGLYSNITKLLTPGLTDSLPENLSNIVVDVRVVRVEGPAQDKFLVAEDTICTFSLAPPAFVFNAAITGGSLPQAILTGNGIEKSMLCQRRQSAAANATHADYLAYLADRDTLPPGEYSITLRQRTFIDHTLRLLVFAPPKGNDVLWKPGDIVYGRKRKLAFQAADFSKSLNYYDVVAFGARSARTIIWSENYRDTAPAFGINPFVLSPPSRTLTVRLEWTNTYTGKTYNVFQRSSAIEVESPVVEVASENAILKPNTSGRSTAVFAIPPITIFTSPIGNDKRVNYPNPDVTCKLEGPSRLSNGTSIRIRPGHWVVEEDWKLTMSDATIEVFPSGVKTRRMEYDVQLTVTTPALDIGGLHVPENIEPGIVHTLECAGDEEMSKAMVMKSEIESAEPDFYNVILSAAKNLHVDLRNGGVDSSSLRSSE